MTKTFCDRCGKETARCKLFTISTGSVITKEYEVCADCKEAFWRFMRDGKETEEENDE